MATNNNLQDLRLGAPPSISISANQYPHAALTVQTMELCHTLTLHDAADGTRCTDEGAMVTAARLLSQLMHERSISVNAEGWSITYDVRALADAAVYGGADHPVPMSLTGADGAAVCWAVEGDATPGVSLSADGVLTLPAGCTDTLRIKAIRWDDREVRAMTTIPVSDWREVADLLVQYPQLAEVLAQYPQLAEVLAERPSLAAVVASFPNLAYRASKQNDYVQEGLVMMLNPLTATAEEWKDWVDSSRVFAGNGKVKISSDGVPMFDGNGYMENSGMSMHNASTHTIEVVYKGDNASYSANHLYREDFSNGLSAGMYGNEFITSTGVNKTTYNVGVHNILKTVSVSSIAISNNEKATAIGNNNWEGNNTNKAYIGTRYSGNQNFTGKIYEIRIYNRLLTEAEILHNQAIDLAVYANL